MSEKCENGLKTFQMTKKLSQNQTFDRQVEPKINLAAQISANDINSNLTQNQILILTSNQTVTQMLTFSLKNINEKSANEYFSFSFYSLWPKIFGEIVSPLLNATLIYQSFSSYNIFAAHIWGLFKKYISDFFP